MPATGQGVKRIEPDIWTTIQYVGNAAGTRSRNSATLEARAVLLVGAGKDTEAPAIAGAKASPMASNYRPQSVQVGSRRQLDGSPFYVPNVQTDYPR